MAVTCIPTQNATRAYVDSEIYALYAVAATERLICPVNRGLLLFNEVILDGYLKLDGVGRLI